MRLLDLHDQVQSWLTQDRISVGHAKVLLSLKSQEEQSLLAEEIIRQNLTVRAAEKLVTKHFAESGTPKPTRNGAPATPAKPALGPAIQNLQNQLQQHLATHVTLHHGEKRGRIEIEYYGNDDLHRLIGLFGLKLDDK
jgi:ParB family chromosome partitioning protein